MNGDGFLLIGVIASDCGDTAVCDALSRPAGGDTPFGSENIIVTNERPERLNIFGCSVTIHAEDPNLPVITVKDSVGKVTILDLHVKNSNVAGYKVEASNDDLVVLKNGRAMNNAIGYWILDDEVEVTGSPQISGNGIGIKVEGDSNVLRDNNHINENTGDGIFVTGDANQVRDNNSTENGGNGIHVTGDDNNLLDNETDENTLNGILATDAEGANGNQLHGNSAEENTLQGIRACNQIDDDGNDGQDNGVAPEIDFTCAVGPAVFYVADDQDDQVYQYNASVQFLGSFDLTGNNGAANGVTVIGTDVYVLDKSDDQVYKYTTAGALVATSKVLKDTAAGSLGGPTGLAIDGDDLWIADDSNTASYRYSLAAAFAGAGNLNALQTIDFTGGNGSAEGLAIDATNIYVLDDSDKQFYRYPRAGGAETASKVLEDTGGDGLNSPSGANLSGATMYVADRGDDILYAYSLASVFSGAGNVNASSQTDLNSDNEDARGL
ncbi:MAG: right-handed parallel beta-helix repeat-containing protein [Candidatus Hydrogenedentes bacterium]|nr:right-handed parallel beta-helix repeat-containing protein [Candidatus Hydrogenedentota bacterium]